MNTSKSTQEEPFLDDSSYPSGSLAGEPAEPVARPSRRHGGKRWILGVLMAVALLGGGTALGTTLPDPRASDVYRALADEKAGAESDRDSIRSDYDSLKSEYDTLESGMAAKEATLQDRETEVGKAEAAVKSAEAAVKKREQAVTGAEKQKAANTVSDGTWTVGKDIAVGNYRATADVGGSCYWGIYETGSNGSNIIENDIPGGGRPTVVLSTGQDFKSSRCGTWEKQ